MNYIVLDLEWNQSPFPDLENPRIPFEIIEIGAVKINSSFEYVDEFTRIIKPRIYKRLHKHIREILNYDEQVLFTGKPFNMVCRDFLNWCGDDYIFVTWGQSDLTQLQKNMDYYYMNPYDEPFKYYDLQYVFAEEYPELGPCKLEKAVNHLGLPAEESFHSAIHDARYTAKILQHVSKKLLKDMYVYDSYHAPKDYQHEIITFHQKYSEHITRAFNQRLDVMDDRRVTTFYCYRCKRKIAMKMKWFVNNQNIYVAVGKCWYHGYQKGTIRFKNTTDQKIFAIKRTIPIKKDELEAIRNRKLELQEKRKEKRNHRI